MISFAFLKNTHGFIVRNLLAPVIANLPLKCNNLPLPMMIFSADSLTAPII